MGATVAVLGGGVAGLVSACLLAERGHSVTLVEAAATLGGAAATLVDPRTGFEVDLAPPVFTAAPDGLVSWLARIGASDRLLDFDVSPLELVMPGHAVSLTAPALPGSILPGSMRLAASFLAFDALEPVDRARAVVGALLMRVGRPRPAESDSFYRWLRRTGQSSLAVTRLWNPLCIATCGLPVEEVAADVALPALAPILGTGKSGFRMALARSGFARLFNPLAADALRARGVLVMAGQPARRLFVSGEAVHAVELADGRHLKPDAVIACLPPAALLALLPDAWAAQGPFAMASKLRFAPRASVHLFYDRCVMSAPVAGTCGEEPVWLVNRRRSGPGADLRSGGPVAGVSVYPAAGSAFLSLEREEAIGRADALVRSVSPESRDACLVHALTVVQPSAVLLAGPGSMPLRPGPATPLANFWLAGSWTATGLPGSLESAHVSGRRAAEAAEKYISNHVAGSRGAGHLSASRSNLEEEHPVVAGSTLDRRPLSTTLDPARWGGHTS